MKKRSPFYKADYACESASALTISILLPVQQCSPCAEESVVFYLEAQTPAKKKGCMICLVELLISIPYQLGSQNLECSTKFT